MGYDPAVRPTHLFLRPGFLRTYSYVHGRPSLEHPSHWASPPPPLPLAPLSGASYRLMHRIYQSVCRQPSEDVHVRSCRDAIGRAGVATLTTSPLLRPAPGFGERVASAQLPARPYPAQRCRVSQRVYAPCAPVHPRIHTATHPCIMHLVHHLTPSPPAGSRVMRGRYPAVYIRPLNAPCACGNYHTSSTASCWARRLPTGALGTGMEALRRCAGATAW
jgi:hypothetical protein